MKYKIIESENEILNQAVYNYAEKELYSDFYEIIGFFLYMCNNCCYNKKFTDITEAIVNHKYFYVKSFLPKIVFDPSVYTRNYKIPDPPAKEYDPEDLNREGFFNHEYFNDMENPNEEENKEINDVLLGQYIIRRNPQKNYNRKIVLYYKAIYDEAQNNSNSFNDQISVVLAHEILHYLHELFLFCEKMYYIGNSEKHTWYSVCELPYFSCHGLNLSNLNYPKYIDYFENVVPIVKESLAKFFEIEWCKACCKNNRTINYQNEINRLKSAPYCYPYKHYTKIRSFTGTFFEEQRNGIYWSNAFSNM